jgi:hypothetical protein
MVVHQDHMLVVAEVVQIPLVQLQQHLQPAQAVQGSLLQFLVHL